MKHCVIEKAGDLYDVTLHPSREQAESYAVEIAAENTAYSEHEIREHLQDLDKHSEGDYEVILINAREIS